MKTTTFAEYQLSQLMLGTVQFGMQYGIANRQGRPSYETVREILAVAFEGGVNCLDTAAAYGESEELIGRFLKSLDHEAVSVIIPGASSAAQATRNAAASALPPLPEELHRELRGFYQAEVARHIRGPY